MPQGSDSNDRGKKAEHLGFREKRLYVDSRNSEYVDVGPEEARKIRDLLESQEHVASDDVLTMFASSDKIQGANCHKTALYLTGRFTKEQLFAHDNDDPQTAGHEYVEEHSNLFPNLESARSALGRAKFPFRLSFFKEKNGQPFAYHSITILGTSNCDTLVGFEKEGPYADNPFKYIDVVRTMSNYLSRGYSLGIEKKD